MQTFKVWDEFNSSEEHAVDVEAFNANWAAEQYAEEDIDGNIDGIYYDGNEPMRDLKKQGHIICVRSPDGTLGRFAVGVIEFEPVYGSEELASGEREDKSCEAEV